MNPRRTRRLLRFAATAMIGASVVCGVWALVVPCALPSIEMSHGDDRRPPAGLAPPDRPPLASFAPIFARRFYAPLYDPPPVANQPAPQRSTPPPRIVLLATFVEKGGNQAMLSDAAGSIQILKVGQRINDGTSELQVVEINPSDVVVLHQGRRIILELEQ